jgi:hypothetical protein
LILPRLALLWVTNYQQIITMKRSTVCLTSAQDVSIDRLILILTTFSSIITRVDDELKTFIDWGAPVTFYIIGFIDSDTSDTIGCLQCNFKHDDDSIARLETNLALRSNGDICIFTTGISVTSTEEIVQSFLSEIRGLSKVK